MDLQSIERDALAEIESLNSVRDLESAYTKYLGRKEGQLTSILRQLGSLSPDEKKKRGQEANEVREKLEEHFATKRHTLQQAALDEQVEQQKIDPTLPGTAFHRGASHPILQAIDDITAIFRQLGFNVVEGPEVETDTNNFTALNIPENHPARDSHDTFYLHAKDSNGKPLLMRTHTSPVQIRLMQNQKPPIRIVSPGRVYRHEAVDATHAAIFHQIEGLVVDKNVSFADLKGTLTYFAKKYFGEYQKVRLRPGYFPFVEPGAEIDLQCFVCSGKRVTKEGNPCGLCKATGWIEMLGAGMVHPQVLRNVGYDPEVYTGFAFGMGIERIVMSRYGVTDIRSFLESDLRFLEQFA